jgi:lysophospholipase L1-like esterase
VSRSAGILVLFLFAACGLAAYAAQPVADPDPARFAGEIAAFEAWDRQNAFPRDGILFAGSSSIRMWPTAQSFPDLPVINRGFGGSHISDVNHYVEQVVLKYRPRAVVFYAGDNDVDSGKSPQQVLADFKEFVATVHNELPSTRIIYLPIKPSILRWQKWPQMKATNELVQQFIAKNDGLEYVDTATPMLGPDGQPRKEFFLDDGLHMNSAGYELWAGILGSQLRVP